MGGKEQQGQSPCVSGSSFLDRRQEQANKSINVIFITKCHISEVIERTN